MKRLAILLLILNAPWSMAKESCQLSPSEIVHIGCTWDCGFFNKASLYWEAYQRDYNIEISNLSQYDYELDDIDAVIIPGGADISLGYYLGNLSSELKSELQSKKHLINYSAEGVLRDHFEYQFLTEFLSQVDQSKPLLGICRGMQMLAVHAGIPLYLDLQEELGIENRQAVFDEITVTDEQSQLSSILQTKSFEGHEIHHQGIRLNYYQENTEQWPQVKVTATSHSGKIAEGFEYSDRPIVGVQFHPEVSFNHSQVSLFSWLLEEACQSKIKRRLPHIAKE